MKKKKVYITRGYRNRIALNRRPIIYVELFDETFGSSVNGDKIAMQCLKTARVCVRSQQKSVSSTVKSRKTNTFVSMAEAKNLSTIVAEKTGLNIPGIEILKKIEGIYPPLGIKVNGKVVKIIK